MKKVLFLSFVFAAFTSRAQEEEACEGHHSNMFVSMYEKDLSKLKSELLSGAPSSEKRDMLPMITSGNEPKQYFDYFPAQMFLDEKSPASAVENHKIEKHLFSGITTSLNGISYDNLDCTEIKDKYSITHPITGIIYHYENEYFHFRDRSGQEIATLIYIKRSIGSLVTESRFLKSYTDKSNSAALHIYPNPAKDVLNIKMQINYEGKYNIYIKDWAGKRIMQPVQNQFFAKGEQQASFGLNLLPGNYYVVLAGDKNEVVKTLLIK